MQGALINAVSKIKHLNCNCPRNKSKSVCVPFGENLSMENSMQKLPFLVSNIVFLLKQSCILTKHQI